MLQPHLSGPGGAGASCKRNSTVTQPWEASENLTSKCQGIHPTLRPTCSLAGRGMCPVPPLGMGQSWVWSLLAGCKSFLKGIQAFHTKFPSKIRGKTPWSLLSPAAYSLSQGSSNSTNSPGAGGASPGRAAPLPNAIRKISKLREEFKTKGPRSQCL